MYINRPLIHGLSTKKNKSNSLNQSKNLIRIKTLPSSVHVTTKQIPLTNDITSVQNSLIGIKDVKQIMDGQLLTLIQRVQQLEGQTEQQYRQVQKKSRKVLGSVKSTIGNNSGVNEQMSTKRQEENISEMVYEQCRAMLQLKAGQQQKTHSTFISQLKITLLQLQQLRIELQQIKKTQLSQIQTSKQSISKLEHQSKIITKKLTNKQRLLQQIDYVRQQIQKMNQKLIISKQQSVRQKNEFVEVQAEEIRLSKEIQDEEDQEMRWMENQEQFQYMRRMEKLKVKLMRMRNKDEEKIDEFFNQKINAIVKIRVRNDQFQDEIQSLQSKIEEQLAIINMLSTKHSQLEKQFQFQEKVDSSHAYREKYNQIFLNNNYQFNGNHGVSQVSSQAENQYRELDHWQNYKKYLEKILKNQKRLKDQSRVTTRQHSQAYDKEYERQDPNYAIYNSPTQLNKPRAKPSLQSSLINLKPTSSKPTGIPQSPLKPQPFKKAGSVSKVSQISSTNPVSPSPKSRTPLPKLIKLEGKLQDSNKIKHQLTKFTNQEYDEDIELETVRSSQADNLEDVIEVEFKGTKMVKKDDREVEKKGEVKGKDIEKSNQYKRRIDNVSVEKKRQADSPVKQRSSNKNSIANIKIKDKM